MQNPSIKRIKSIIKQLDALKAHISDMREHLEGQLTEANNIGSLQQKYAQFNMKLFGGKLPKNLPIKFAKLPPNIRGRVTAKVMYPNQSMQNGTLQPNSMFMEISNEYMNSNDNIDGILIHEMIHVYFNSIGDFKQNHGPKFVAMAKRLSNHLGYEIPLGDKK